MLTAGFQAIVAHTPKQHPLFEGAMQLSADDEKSFGSLAIFDTTRDAKCRDE